MAVVLLPRALVELFPGAERRVEVGGATLGELISGLDARWPGMRDRLCDGPGPDAAVRRHLRVLVDGAIAGTTTQVRPGSTVHVLLAVSGG